MHTIDSLTFYKRMHMPMVGKLPLADIFCVVLLAEQQYFKLTASCRLIFYVCFIYQRITRVRKVLVAKKSTRFDVGHFM